jgi:hypothetical protein
MNPTEKERKILAFGYDSEFYRALFKQLEKRQMDLAQSAVNVDDIKQVHILRGQIMEIKWLHSELKKIYAKDKKKEAAAS